MNKHFLLSRCFCSLVIILFFCIDFAVNVTICWFSLKLVCCSLNFLLLLSFSQEFLADNSLFGGTTSLLCLFVLEWTLFLIQTHPRLWAFTCSCMFSLLSPLPAAAPFFTLAPSKSPSVRQLQSAVFLSVRHWDTWQSPAVAVSHFELIIPSFFSDLSDYEGSRANLTSKDDRCHALPCPNLHFSKNPGFINPER